MFISFVFCLFFKTYNNGNFLELLLSDLAHKKNVVCYNKIFNLTNLLNTKYLDILNQIYSNNNIVHNFCEFLRYISKNFYYSLITDKHINEFVENVDLQLELMNLVEKKSLIFLLLTSFFLLLLCVDAKHVSNHSLDKNVLLNILNLDSFIFLMHYYKGIGGHESDFFVRDYDLVMDKIIKYLLNSKVVNAVKLNHYFGKYVINLKKLSYEHFLVFSMMAHEGPVVRVQREPENDAKKMHTSTIGVLLICMPIISDIQSMLNLFMDSKYIKIDIFRASGAGGQHVNKTSSAVRVTHSLFDISVVSQDSRSQIANRKSAFDRLREKIYRDFSDGVSLLVNSHFIRLHRSMKSETFHYKRKMIHFHDDFLKDSFNIIIDSYKDYSYFIKVFHKFLNLF